MALVVAYIIRITIVDSNTNKFLYIFETARIIGHIENRIVFYF